MKSQSILLIGVSVLTTIANQAIANVDPYLEQSGRLIVELEAESVEGDWSKQNAIYGHTGAGYLVWDGRNNYSKSEAPRGNPIQYHFRVSTPGNYELRWRSRNTVGNEATEHNDSWVRFPTGKNVDGEHFLDGWTKAYMGQVAQWTWDAYTVDNDNKPIRQFFSEGDHIIEIAGRSNGHGLDRLALFRYQIEDFSIDLFETLAQSPKASQSALPRHTYAGNTCVGSTLSLAAYTKTISDIDSSIRVDNAEQSALLRFDIPQVQMNKVTLKLASTQPSLALSAYLGSHSEWTSNTPAQDLPYASTLLGTIQSEAALNQVLNLDLDNMNLPAKPLTIILESMSGNTQFLHGISTVLEPRLDIEVSQDFCLNYQAARISAESQGTDDQTQNTVDTNTSAPTTETETETETKDSSSTETSDNQSPFEIVDPRTEDESETVSDKSVRKSGGALSGLTLFVLMFTSCFYRTREKMKRAKPLHIKQDGKCQDFLSKHTT